MNLRSAILLVLGCIFFVSCKSPEARKPVQQSSGSFIKESAKRNKVLYKKEEARIASIMEANPEHDYLSSDRGFWYYYNVKDSLDVPTPDFGDVVTFTYNIQSLEGEPILTESETGLQTYKIDQSNQDLISGLRDGVKLMKVGEQISGTNICVF